MADEKKVDTKAAKEDKQAEKRASFFHTDSGFAVNIVDGEDLAPTARYTDGLEGLLEKVKELQKEGFEVDVEGVVLK